MLGHEEVVEAELVGQNSLRTWAINPRWLDSWTSARLPSLIATPDERPHHREIGRAIMENAYFDHMPSVRCRSSRAVQTPMRCGAAR